MFLDFSKAFDTVPDERLLLKLHSYGIREPLLSWVRGFLTNRHQRVVVRRTIHPQQQCSLRYHRQRFKALFYSSFISTSQCKLFADHIKVYKVLRNTEEDMHVLQKDLHSLEQWSPDWQLSFNIKKCEVMRISKKNDKSSPEY